jgi:hypothetical protein
MVTPAVAASFWYAFENLTPGSIAFWPATSLEDSYSRWVALLLLAGAIGALASTQLHRSHDRHVIVVSVAVFYVAVALVSLWPRYSQPTYTLRSCSRELQRWAREADWIGVVRAEGLSIDNELEMRSARVGRSAQVSARDSPPSERAMDLSILAEPKSLHGETQYAEVVVVNGEPRSRELAVLAQAYDKVAQCDIRLATDFFLQSKALPDGPLGAQIGVYVRKNVPPPSPL